MLCLVLKLLVVRRMGSCVVHSSIVSHHSLPSDELLLSPVLTMCLGCLPLVINNQSFCMNSQRMRSNSQGDQYLHPQPTQQTISYQSSATSLTSGKNSVA